MHVSLKMQGIMKVIFIWELFLIGSLLSLIQLAKTGGKNDSSSILTKNSKRSLDFPTIFYPGPDNKFITAAPPPSLPPHLKIFSPNRSAFLAPLTSFQPILKKSKDETNSISTTQGPVRSPAKILSVPPRTHHSAKIQKVLSTTHPSKEIKNDIIQKGSMAISTTQHSKLSETQRDLPNFNFQLNLPLKTSEISTDSKPVHHEFFTHSQTKTKINDQNQNPPKQLFKSQSFKELKSSVHEMSSPETTRNHVFNFTRFDNLNHHHHRHPPTHNEVHLLPLERPFSQSLLPSTSQKPILSSPTSPSPEAIRASPSPAPHLARDRSFKFSPPQGPFSPRELPVWRPKSFSVTLPPPTWRPVSFSSFPVRNRFVSMKSQPRPPGFHISHLHKPHIGTSSVKTRLSSGELTDKSSNNDRNPEKTEVNFSSLDKSRHLKKQLLPSFDKDMSSHRVKSNVFLVSSDLRTQDFGRLSQNAFSCRFHLPGYYADIGTGCTMFHICHRSRQYTFMCPKGTLFSQRLLTCDWAQRVKCSSSSNSLHNHLL